MKATSLKTAVLLAGSIALLAGNATAQATSGVVGYRTETVKTGFNLVGANLHNPVLVGGVLDTESGVTLGDSGVDYTTILTDANATYIFEILDGGQAGAIAEITTIANGSVDIDGAIGAGVGAAYSIRQAPTLNDTFPDLQVGFTAATADVVYVPNGVGGGYDTYFKHQTSGNYRVAGAFVDPPKPISFLYSDGILVERKGAADVEVVITGALKTTGTVVNMPTGFGAVVVSAPAGSTLQTTALESVLQTGFTAATADVVYVPTGTPGAYDTYFVHQTSGNFRVAGQFVDAADVPVDNALLIERKGADTAGLINVPSFYSTL